MELIDKEKLNWDNNFSIRFKLENGKSLEKIPNNIFEIDLPEINTKDVNEENIDRYIAIVLRSTQDGLVEKEVYDVLFRTNFDIELSLSNPNKIDYVYKSCSVEKLNFAPLMNRPKANPFNFTVWAKVSQIIFKGSTEEIIFGSQNNAPIDYNEDNNEGDE
nr:MAG TPA: hypothetical protein [Caudoviricetes sp.]